MAFQSLIDIDSEAAVGLDAETHSLGDGGGEYIALGERFSASDPLGNKDSNHGQSDSKGGDSPRDKDANGGVAGPFASGDEGGSGIGDGQIASASEEPAIGVNTSHSQTGKGRGKSSEVVSTLPVILASACTLVPNKPPPANKGGREEQLVSETVQDNLLCPG